MSSFSRTLVTFIGCAAGAIARSNFLGGFVLSDVSVDSPFQADPSTTNGSIISFTFADEDLPQADAVHCSIEWAVGLSPPSVSGARVCDNGSVGAWIPQGTYKGVGDLSIALSHTYVDDSVGEYPYNRLTKFGSVNLTYPGTPEYECEISEAYCSSCEGASIVATVTQAIA